MSDDGSRRPVDTAGSAREPRQRWFGPNRSGVGFRPYAWRSWLILVVVVAAIIAVVVLWRVGVL